LNRNDKKIFENEEPGFTKILIDPDNILDGSKHVKITIDGVNDGFQINTNRMIVGQWYFFIYKGEKFYMTKDEDGTLNMGTDINY
jgi:hypothetical protein